MKAAGEITQPSYTSSLLDENEAKGGGRAGEDIISASAATLFAGTLFPPSIPISAPLSPSGISLLARCPDSWQ